MNIKAAYSTANSLNSWRLSSEEGLCSTESVSFLAVLGSHHYQHDATHKRLVIYSIIVLQCAAWDGMCCIQDARWQLTNCTCERLWLAVWMEFRRKLRHNNESSALKGCWRCLRCGTASQIRKEVIFS
jgi:hypothetical protein